MTSGLPILDQRAPREHVPGDVERALAELWPTARQRVDTFRYWRETWALRRKFSLRFIRLGELKVKIPQGQLPDCETCEDLCCTGPNAIVSLRLRDIAALVDARLDRFIVARSQEQKTRGNDVFHDVFPVLDRDPTGTCRLLTDDRLCGAHPAWPLSCARYPYALDAQLKVVFWAEGCRSTTEIPAVDAPIRVRALVRAAVDGYNERIKDAVLLHTARPELEALGLLKFLDLSRFSR